MQDNKPNNKPNNPNEIHEKLVPPFPSQDIDGLPGLEKELDPKPVEIWDDYQSSNKLKGKVAVVTGGDSGIGRATVRLFAREGAKVAFCCKEEEKADAEATMERIKQEGSEGFYLIGDVTDYSFCNSFIEEVIKRYNAVDILVNNAAFQEHIYDIENLSLDHWNTTFNVNVNGYFIMAKVAVPHMKAGSSIINISSITGHEGTAGLLDYSSTKGAINSFTKSLALQLVPKGIRVNAVSPGPVWTPLNPAERPEEEVKTFGQYAPYNRPAQPAEIAPACLFLASNLDSSYISGEIIRIFGGITSSG